MKIISWNIACIPEKCNLFGDPKHRIDDIIKSILEEEADIICLQEVFCKSVRDRLIAFFTAIHYNFVLSDEVRWGLNGGLLLATKFEILHYEKHIFQNSCGEDSLAKKGFLFTILKNKDQLISCINTHMNATPIIPGTKNSNLTRVDQFDSILKKIKQQETSIKNMLNVFCGDINTDYDTHPLVHFLNEMSNVYNVRLNDKKLKTYFEIQLDYIIFYTTQACTLAPIYRRKISILSDHNMLLCNY